MCVCCMRKMLKETETEEINLFVTFFIIGGILIGGGGGGLRAPCPTWLRLCFNTSLNLVKAAIKMPKMSYHVKI